MEWEEVMILRQAIPCRFPQGDPRNRQRIKPEQQFEAALVEYEREHGMSWFNQPGRDYNQEKPGVREEARRIASSITEVVFD